LMYLIQRVRFLSSYKIWRLFGVLFDWR
jgi:hypothetical protein